MRLEDEYRVRVVEETFWAEARLGHYEATGSPVGYWPDAYARDYEIATGKPWDRSRPDWLPRWRYFLWRLTGGAIGI